MTTPRIALRYFVSGHLDLTEAEFAEHYIARLTAAMQSGGTFVVGDARGCDAMTQAWLAKYTEASVRVFHMLERPRNLIGPVLAVHGGFLTDDERDTAMTLLSDEDLAWVRPGRENSGTAQNLARRRQSRPVHWISKVLGIP